MLAAVGRSSGSATRATEVLGVSGRVPLLSRNDMCGYSQRYAMAKCNDKLRCDADCQRETCRALVRFHGSLSSKMAYDEDSSGAEKWLTEPEQCDSLASFGYCSWLGIECCCLKNVSRVPLLWRLCQVVQVQNLQLTG